MIEDEVRLALERAYPEGGAPPLVWVESGLHDHPNALRDELQGLLDLLDGGAAAGIPVSLPSKRTVPDGGDGEHRVVQEDVSVPSVTQALLAFGYCGTGIRGLTAQRFALVFPRVDDCISLLLNHGCLREEIVRDARAYYLTRGWLSRPGGVQQSFSDWAERYGEERAQHLRKMMYAGYERVTLIDTGAYDMDACKPGCRQFADELGLDEAQVEGSLQLLERLFARGWSRDAKAPGAENTEIVVVPAGRPVSLMDIMIP